MINKKLFLVIVMFLIVLPSVFSINATKSRYDLTNSSKVDDVYGFVKEVNNLTDKMFMSGILLVSFVILFVAFSNKGTEDALLGAGFITTWITVLFTALDLVPRLIAILIFVSYGLFFVVRLVRG